MGRHESELLKRGVLVATALPWFGLAIGMLLKWKAYSMNYQAFNMWENYTPISAFLAGHQHALRYLAYWPVFEIARFLNVAPNAVFTGASWLALVVLTVTVIRSSALIDAAYSAKKSLIYSIVVFLLAIAMDGRLAFALSGFSIAIWVTLEFVSGKRWTPAYFAVLLVAGVLASVSSGALSVFFMFLALFLCWSLSVHRSETGNDLKMRLCCAAVLLMLSPAVIRGALINVEFFGGGISGVVNMLRHGVGKVFLLVGPVGIAVLMVAAVCGLIAVAWLRSRQSASMFLLTLAIVPAAIGGLFGLSTMALGIVPLMLVVRWQLWHEVLGTT